MGLLHWYYVEGSALPKKDGVCGRGTQYRDPGHCPFSSVLEATLLIFSKHESSSRRAALPPLEPRGCGWEKGFVPWPFNRALGFLADSCLSVDRIPVDLTLDSGWWSMACSSGETFTTEIYPWGFSAASRENGVRPFCVSILPPSIGVASLVIGYRTSLVFSWLFRQTALYFSCNCSLVLEDECNVHLLCCHQIPTLTLIIITHCRPFPFFRVKRVLLVFTV